MAVVVADVVLALAALPVLVASGYLALLAAFSRRQRPPAPRHPRLRFDVIVPAHDEETGIAATVQSLLTLDYPRDLFRVVVVADNCTDATAARAAEAGAAVLERRDPERRGKGQALAWAFERCTGDAVAVIDADTVASPNLLRAFSARLEAGASAVQADYGVRNPGTSWRTRLMVIALAMFHVLRSLARERLGVSCGLRGNGMCFTRALLREVPHEAFSIVEDLEYGIRIGEAGHRVHYAAEAHVYGEMVSQEKAARSQRQRWEGGRLQIARRHGFRLLRLALARRDAVLLDLAMDVLVPPLSVTVAMVAVGLAASLALSNLALWVWTACGLLVATYVLRGWQLSGTGLRGLAGLMAAPAYLVWRAALMFRRRPHDEDWIRTAREGQAR